MTTHYGWAGGRTLCGQPKGLGAQWHPGATGPRVDCAECVSRNQALPQDKKFP